LSRPLGVTLLSIYYALHGVALVLIALGIVAFEKLSPLMAATILGALPLPPLAAVETPIPVTSVLAVMLLLAAVLYFALAYGLWHLRPWAWWLTMLILALGLIGSIGVLVAAVAVAVAAGEPLSPLLLPVALPVIFMIAITVYMIKVRTAFLG